ncbi:MAG TPA: hypothetical protein VM869_19195 [Enhygromyxa sp.]|nr:hypothetical protein [Enhygromyxa sp.]
MSEPTLLPLGPKPNEAAVKLARELLERCEAGEIQGFVLTAFYTAGRSSTRSVGTLDDRDRALALVDQHADLLADRVQRDTD